MQNGLLDDPIDSSGVGVTTPPTAQNNTSSYDAASDGLLDNVASSNASPYDPVKDVTDGLLDDSVADINKLTANDSPLMKQAATRGAQVANSRGTLNSTMGAQAGQAAVLDTVMPLVQQTADIRGNTALQNNDTDNRSRLMTEETQNQSQLMGEQFGIDSNLMDQEFSGKENLINLEQEWNNLIQSNINAAESWKTDMDGIMDILNNKDLTPEQVQNRLDLAFGTVDASGNVLTEGYISANLEFISNLANLPFPGINNSVRSAGQDIPNGAIADINAVDGYKYPDGVDDPRTGVDESYNPSDDD